MTWLLTAAVALAVVAWGSRRVGARGEWPHDPEFDGEETPTRGDAKGWVDRSRPVAAAPAGARSPEAGPCSPATEKGRALNHGWAPVPPPPTLLDGWHGRGAP